MHCVRDKIAHLPPGLVRVLVQAWSTLAAEPVGNDLEGFQDFRLKQRLKPSPESCLDCHICADFTWQPPGIHAVWIGQPRRSRFRPILLEKRNENLSGHTYTLTPESDLSGHTYK